MQSALAPAGPAAQAIASLATVLAVGAAVILGLVIALLAYGALSGPRRVHTGLWVVGGGIVFPVVVLSALLLYDRGLTHALSAPPPPGAPTIEVEGRQWWWEVRYRPGAAGQPVVAANELHVPVGVAVDLVLTTPDVIHSFWVPSLAGKVDMVPGHRNRLTIQADRAGIYRGQCAEFCGVQHARMALLVVAVPPAEFEAWLAREAAPAAPPTTPALARGHDAFLAHGCGGCHAIRGTAALSRLGPDLTHVGSRRTLAAATIPNHVEAMAAWISSSEQLKPGNRMRSFAHLDRDTVTAIAAYLASLR
ncbi:MAG: cytochrome c oxidase subunit II [Candidatus Rokuibacteriota bacterium]